MSTSAKKTIEKLKRTLSHPEPPALWYQLEEIVGDRVYLRHGIEVSKGDVVLDVGANVGVAAAFFAECGAARVHSFEPVPRIFEQLVGNLRQFPCCTAHPYGLSSRSGTANVSYYPHDWAISGQYADPVEDRALLRRLLLNTGWNETDVETRLEGRFQAVRVNCKLRTLSEALRRESIEHVDLLKIDVEKAELDVLTGIEEPDWRRIKQVVAEVHLDRDGRTAFEAVLGGHGLRPVVDQQPSMRGTPIHMVYARRE